ncbi:MAG: hypothetical protein ACE5GJ_12630 [Gemmatimonadota bacterium]
MKPLADYTLRPERIALALMAVAGALIVLHLLAMQAFFNPALGLKERFGLEYWHVAILDLDAEESFGTWFSSGLLALAGSLLLVEVRARDDVWRRWWLVLALGFFFLSLDEVAGLHEYVNTLMEDTPWTVLGAAVFTVVGIAYLPFLWHYRGRTALLFLVAAAIYGGGAVGVEHFTDSDVNSLHYNMWTTLEEGMEMTGVVVFIYALLDHLRGSADRAVRLTVGSQAQPTAAQKPQS